MKIVLINNFAENFILKYDEWWIMNHNYVFFMNILNISGWRNLSENPKLIMIVAPGSDRNIRILITVGFYYGTKLKCYLFSDGIYDVL